MFSLARLCNASKSATPSTARYGAYRESYGLPWCYIAKRINFSIPAELQGAIELIRASGVPNDTANDPANAVAQDSLSLPICMKCRAGQMSLTHSEEAYPGYERRTFECPVCNQTMTQWAHASD